MAMPTRILRLAMIGGGPGSFIGPVHRMAAGLDGRFALAAGVFSRDPHKSQQAGATFGIDATRVYGDYDELLTLERRRKDPVDVVAIVTPNHLHFPIARAALEKGFAVISDKPATATLVEAQELQRVVERTGGFYALTYTYSGYPLVREARARVAAGEIGAVRKIIVEYSQGWLSERVELTGQRQAQWRCDPAQSGVGGCSGDIGVHAFQLLEFVSGRRVVELCADVSTVVAGRALDDDCNVLLRLDNGAPAVLHATQIGAGERNGLRLRVYGESGAIEWAQESPNRLCIHRPDGTTQIVHAGASALSPAARAVTRLPSGHPEGYVEAFANIYRDVAERLIERGEPTALCGIEVGVRGMAFIECALANSRARAGWSRLTP
jgi:predicted dehydrogenase